MTTQLLLSPEIQPFKVRGYSPKRGPQTTSGRRGSDAVFRKPRRNDFDHSSASGCGPTVCPVTLIASTSSIDLGNFGAGMLPLSVKNRDFELQNHVRNHVGPTWFPTRFFENHVGATLITLT